MGSEIPVLEAVRIGGIDNRTLWNNSAHLMVERNIFLTGSLGHIQTISSIILSLYSLPCNLVDDQAHPQSSEASSST